MTDLPPTDLEGPSGEAAAKAAELPGEAVHGKEKAAPAKPKKHVVSKNVDADPVAYDTYVSPASNKSLTIYHVQRRIAELGFTEGLADPGGRNGELTQYAVKQWQKSVKAQETGILTRKQFEAIFENDPSVSLS